jgi:hypothetical protein
VARYLSIGKNIFFTLLIHSKIKQKTQTSGFGKPVQKLLSILLQQKIVGFPCTVGATFFCK